MQHNPPHPGQILLEFYLQPLGFDVASAAKILNVHPLELANIVQGKAGITTDIAIKLSKQFQTSDIFWMKMQDNFDCGTNGQ